MSDTTRVDRQNVVDTSIVRQIDQDQGITALLTFGSIILIALFLWMATADLSAMRRAPHPVFSWLMVILLGGITVVWGRRLLMPLNPVITLSPEGILDRRLGPDMVPWKSVTEVKEWRRSRTKMVVLQIDPAVEKRLGRSLFRRMTGQLDRFFSYGWRYSALSTDVDHARLMTLITAYANDHGKASREPNGGQSLT